VLDVANKDDFIYFDPPYYPLTDTANFTSYDNNCFLEDEQIKLFEVFKKLDNKGCFVVLSNSDTSFIKNLYKEYNINIVYANRFINSKSSGRGKITEVLVRNYNGLQ
jgi:DNA adenine methylase